MDRTVLIRIERLNYILGALLIGGAALLVAQDQALGVTVGVLIACANFSIIRRLVDKTLQAGQDKKLNPSVLFVPKMTGLIAVVALALYFLPISPMAVAVGFSIFLVSITFEAIRYMTTPVIN